MKPTPQQENVILSPEGNILVSAAAGSGKTSVMTQRITGRIIDGRADIQNLLVMTFTDAAAKSMRTKIEKALKEKIETTTEKTVRQRIYKQLSYISQSNISTIHSFCLEIIKNFYFELVDDEGNLVLEPGFRIADPDEALMLKANTLKKVIERRYEAYDEGETDESSEAFMQLINSYGNFRSDDPVRELILSFYSFLISMPDYIGWMEKCKREILSSIIDFNNSKWLEIIKKGLILRIENAKEGIDELRTLLQNDVALYKTKAKNEETIMLFKEFLKFMEEMFVIVEKDELDWDGLCDLFAKMPDIPEIRKGKEDEIERGEFFRVFTKHFTELIYYTTGRFKTDSYTENFNFDKFYAFAKKSDEIKSDMEEMLPAIRALFDIVEELDREFAKEKREQNIIDFNDFEHMALKLLQTPVVKDYVSDKFTEVYIDEYQDTSSIQEAIVECFTHENCFMVGDVKQSIYKFRHAKPRIFMEKYSGFEKYSGKNVKGGTCFELNTNFRSVEGVLKAVNNVFYQIMSESAGEIEYNDDQALSFHRKSLRDDGKDVKIILTDSDETYPSQEKSGVKMTAQEKEAFNVARVIGNLISEEGVRPKEIAILARTGNVCKTFSDALTGIGIPNEYEGQNVFLESYGLKVLDSLLRIMDNSLLDIHLVSVMTSPVFSDGFSEEELVSIRLGGKDCKYFYECMKMYLETGENVKIKEKLQRFFEYVNSLREKVVHRRISDVLDEVYRNTGLILYANSVPGGRNNSQDIENFISWTGKIQDSRRVTLHGFIKILDDIKERSPEKSPFGIEESVSDSVKIMTIHKSKGLEFENVFLVSAHKSLKRSESKNHVLFSEELGVSFYHVNYGKQYKYPTLPMYAMREEMKTAGIAEEMRLLYVGMTRAMDRLFISGVVSGEDIKGGKGVARITQSALQYDPSKSFPGHFVLSAKSMLEWILISVARNNHAKLYETGIIDRDLCFDENSGETLFFGKCWDIEILNTMAMAEIELKEVKSDEDEGINEQNYTEQKYDEDEINKDKIPSEIEINRDKGEQSLDFKSIIKKKYFSMYPYLRATDTPLKTSVSEIKRREQELPEESDGASFLRGINIILKEPDLTEKSELTSAQKGIAVHSFFRYADLRNIMKDTSCENIIANMEKMLKLKMINENEFCYLKEQSGHFSNYYKSDLAKTIYNVVENNPENIYMEMPFTLGIKSSLLYGEEGFAPNDKTYAQGIIDCWYKAENTGVLIDYKTDNIRGSQEYIGMELSKRYKVQLSLYLKAIEQIENLKVEKCIIWHFGSDREYNIIK